MSIDLRLTDREACSMGGHIIVDGEAHFPCRLIDISEDGARIEIDALAPLPQFFVLVIPMIFEMAGDRSVELRWRDEREAGLRFVSKKHPRAAKFLESVREIMRLWRCAGRGA